MQLRRMFGDDPSVVKIRADRFPLLVSGYRPKAHTVLGWKGLDCSPLLLEMLGRPCGDKSSAFDP